MSGAFNKLMTTQNNQKNLSELFPEYRLLSENEYEEISKNSLIVFDTNVLLDLYRLPEEDAVDILTKMEKLKSRIWIPLQVAEEYSRNRRGVIEDQKKGYTEFIASLEDWYGHKGNSKKENTGKYKVENTLANRRYRHAARLDAEEFIKSLDKSFRKAIKKVEVLRETHPHREEDDQIFIKLNTLFEGRIGCGLSDELLNGENGVYGNGTNGGAARYSLNIPPGFKDAKKTDEEDPTKKRKFGDLIIWYEIIEQAKKENKSIVFITSEDKIDWWWSEGGSKFGPHYLLRKEFSEMTGGLTFYAYRTDNFLSKAENFGVDKIDEAIIGEARNIIESNIAAKAEAETMPGVSGSFNKSSTVKSNIVGSNQEDVNLNSEKQELVPDVGEVHN